MALLAEDESISGPLATVTIEPIGALRLEALPRGRTGQLRRRVLAEATVLRG